MYGFFLVLHNLIRWVVLVFAVVAFVRGLLGWLRKSDWTDRDRKVGIILTSFLDAQLLIGLLLYFIFSPNTRAVFQDFGSVMGNAAMRFFALEHALYMLLAVVFAHVGSVLTKRATDDNDRHRKAAIFYGLALLLIILGMPWTSPLLPGLG
jgi:hypothetical protein